MGRVTPKKKSKSSPKSETSGEQSRASGLISVGTGSSDDDTLLMIEGKWFVKKSQAEDLSFMQRISFLNVGQYDVCELWT